MKKIYSSALFALCFALGSCTNDPIGVDKSDSDNNAPAKITNISHVSDYGALVFKWTAPTGDADFLYTDIRYKINGIEYSKKISRFSPDSTTLDGLDGVKSDFTFYAVDNAGNRSAGENYSAASLESPNNLVAGTVQIESNEFGGVIVLWQNTTGKTVTVEVSYISDAGERKIQTFTSNEADFSGEVKDGLSEPTAAKEFTVTVKDNKGKATPARKYSAPLYEYIKIPRTDWVFPGYNGDSQDQTIGYSSQATNEGDSPQGRVIAMLDGSTTTFWHASWSPSSSYPHWFIIDMRQSVLIREIELQRRQGNGGTAKGFRLYTCKDAPTDASDPVAGYLWEDQGEYDFNPAVNDAQKIKITNSPTARYVKMYFDENHKGSGNYTMFAEFAVWGQRESK